ncbi:DUF692 domain-containing protein [Moritella sp. 24]|uniref:DUF692 domain-containing protein n=1 Tax=Moritella sp. 24 TaxID=2746230 RepID=UPI001BA486A8|nr:DUF692 domain-containing protein [Moritella sp. 24]QUM76952.1 DUF692 domain-containing protein [Moritella sp. 24]
MLDDLVGIGMRPAHYEQLTNSQVDIGWLEVHSENHFEVNSEATYYLDKASDRYPISLHGVGLALSSNELLDTIHVHNIKKLVDRYQPFCISEHLGWSPIAGQHYSDALPIPYTEENLKHVINRVEQVQAILGQAIAIENPARYSQHKNNTLSETDFLSELQLATNCKILLDINNVHISSHQLDFNPYDYLASIPSSIVSEIHLSGSSKHLKDNRITFDQEHGQKVTPEVWQLFEYYLQHSNTIPTLIEWDTNIPQLNELLQEARTAQKMIVKSQRFKNAC